MANQQMPADTKRHGMGDERPYMSYSITRPDKDGKGEEQLGLTHRVTEEGKTKWQAENVKAVKSPLFIVHREAVEWLLDAPKPAAKPAANGKAPKPAAKKVDPKAPAVSGPASGEQAPAPEVPSDLVKQLAKVVQAS